MLNRDVRFYGEGGLAPNKTQSGLKKASYASRRWTPSAFNAAPCEPKRAVRNERLERVTRDSSRHLEKWSLLTDFSSHFVF